MKKNLIILGMTLAGATGVFAQGLTGAVTLKAQAGPGSVDFHIYGPGTNPGQRVSGNVSSAFSLSNRGGDSPVGTAVYTGSLIGGNSSGTGQYQFANGNVYEMEVAAVQGTGTGTVPLADLIPATIENFSVSASTAGEFANEVIDVPGTSSTSGDTADFQIYAWYEGNSQYTSYSAALAAGVPAGFSDPFNNPTTAPPGTPGLLTGARSFNLTSTPEPSTIALGIMGASAFLLRRRTSK